MHEKNFLNFFITFLKQNPFTPNLKKKKEEINKVVAKEQRRYDTKHTLNAFKGHPRVNRLLQDKVGLYLVDMNLRRSGKPTDPIEFR